MLAGKRARAERGRAAPTGGAGRSGTKSARDAAERREGASETWRWRAGCAAGNGAELGRVLGLVRGRGKAAAERRSGWAGKQTGPRRWASAGEKGVGLGPGKGKEWACRKGGLIGLGFALGWLGFGFF